jgi:hypothetical protein
MAVPSGSVEGGESAWGIIQHSPYYEIEMLTVYRQQTASSPPLAAST